MVSAAPNPKWKDKMDITYEQYFRELFEPRVKMAREFERTIGKEKAHEIIRKMCEREEVKSATQVGKKERFKNFQDFLAWIRKTYESPYWSHILTYTLEEAPQEYWFTCKECLYAKTFRELDAADLGYVMLCNTDFAATPAFHPKLRLKRTKTLMQGDDRGWLRWSRLWAMPHGQ